MVRSGETAGKWILIGSPHSHSDQAPRVGDVNMLLSIWGGNTIISNPMIFRPGMWPFPDQQWQLKCAAHSSSGRHSLLTRNRQHVAKARNNIEACSGCEDKWMWSWGIVCEDLGIQVGPEQPRGTLHGKYWLPKLCIGCTDYFIKVILLSAEIAKMGLGQGRTDVVAGVIQVGDQED